MSKVTTPEFRASFPNLSEPRKNDLNGKEEYSVVALFSKGADLSKLEKACKDAMVKKWGSDKSKWPSQIRSPFRKHEEKAKNVEGKQILPNGYEDGGVFVNFKSQQKPQLVDQNVDDVIDKDKIYAGCYLRASVNAYAYDMKGNRGVSFGLGNVQFLKDGDPIGSRSRAVDDFAPVECASSNGESKSSDDLFS